MRYRSKLKIVIFCHSSCQINIYCPIDFKLVAKSFVFQFCSQDLSTAQHFLVFILCRVCKRNYLANSGQTMHHHAKIFVETNPRHYSVLLILWVQRTSDISVFRKFDALLYILCSQATLNTIVSMCIIV